MPELSTKKTINNIKKNSIGIACTSITSDRSTKILFSMKNYE